MSSYSYQSRIYSSTSVSGRKEVKEDNDNQQSSSSQSDDSKKSEKNDSGDMNPTSQKN